jgi:hypothetical protein
MERLLITTSSLAILYTGFLFWDRKRSYEVLATRSIELSQAGLRNVWLVYNQRGFRLVSSRPIWAMLTTGFLVYTIDNELHLEYPWRQAMHTYLIIPRVMLDLEPCFLKSDYYTTHSSVRDFNQALNRILPAVSINNHRNPYIVLGRNIHDKKDIEQAIKSWNLATDSVLRDHFYQDALGLNKYSPPTRPLLGPTGEIPPQTSSIEKYFSFIAYPLIPIVIVVMVLIVYTTLSQ